MPGVVAAIIGTIAAAVAGPLDRLVAPDPWRRERRLAARLARLGARRRRTGPRPLLDRRHAATAAALAATRRELRHMEDSR
ncbi:MAG: hypothetical protein GY736_05915 [Sphingomonas sp.]|uniref:hypothetical protein n=1 Tax=Sphingomonas sp. TaxID=28214 RepID=UPI00258DC4B2|nr:hypothetical protein [Sphingomonas sp.]MCP4025835.1 hypothetical protein [Sphingomonas sp.]